MSHPRPIVTGVDGSPASLTAADYAAGLAERAHAPLHLIHGYLRTPQTYDVSGPPTQDEAAPRQEVEFALRDLAKSLRAEHPGLISVETRQVASTAVSALIELSQGAEITVVGRRGIGGFTELMLGSVSSQLATYGHGPVIVVRPQISTEVAPPLPVLVGLDGSPGSDAALAFAAREADRRRVPLVIANVYTDEVMAATGYAARLVAEAAYSLLEPYPRLAIELRTIAAVNPGAALVDESRNAALVVAGARGRGGFAGLLLGSVGRTLVHHAFCPVAVIHPPGAIDTGWGTKA